MIKPELKRNLYVWGTSILAIDALAYVFATLRTPRIDPTGIEFFLYFFGGGLLCFIALVLLGLGSGRGQIVLIVIDLIALYVWFSYVGLEIMKH